MEGLMMYDEDTAKLDNSEAVISQLRKEWEASGTLAHSDMLLLWATISAIINEYRAAIEFYEDERLEGLSRAEYD